MEEDTERKKWDMDINCYIKTGDIKKCQLKLVMKIENINLKKGKLNALLKV
jgi:hypothetical protein